MSNVDLAALGIYFTFIVLATLVFRKFASDSSQFINGGGTMLWWMAGATAFMTQFSAWTFTGAAAKAYEDGFAVLVLFWGNALGFLIAGYYFAKRYRQLRVETPMQVIRQRFGKPTEQLFTWLQFPLSTLSAAFWLNGLALFAAAVFDISVGGTIVVTGTIVTFIAVSGGSWTVSASNVVQLIILLAVTLVAGAFALYQVEGPARLIEDFPVDFVSGGELHSASIFLLWCSAILIKQSLSINNAITSYRFLVTRNEREAQKAAYLAAILFIIGPVMWFIPPWVAAVDQAQLTQLYPSLEQAANNAAYLYFVEHYMPAGTLGLIMAAMIAATVAPMATALNRNAGIFVRNVYQEFTRRSSSETRLLRVGQWTTLINGLAATAMAWYLSTIENLGFFDLMMLFGALLQLPIAIPSLLSLLVHRTPDWAGWSTVIVGLVVSLFMHFIFSVEWLGPLFDVEAFTPREAIDLTVAATILSQVFITGGYFCLTQWWYKPLGESRERELHGFIHNLNLPLSKDEQSPVDIRQSRYLGKLLIVMGITTALLSLFSLLEAATSLFLYMGGIMLLAGVGLVVQSPARSGMQQCS